MERLITYKTTTLVAGCRPNSNATEKLLALPGAIVSASNGEVLYAPDPKTFLLKGLGQIGCLARSEAENAYFLQVGDVVAQAFLGSKE